MNPISRIDVVSLPVSGKTVWRHLVVTDEDGAIGVGEYTTGRGGEDLDGYATQVVSAFVADGEATAGPALAQKLGGSFRAWAIASALDQALADLDARAHNRPLAQYLDARASLDPVPLYANVNRRTDVRTPEGFATSAAAAVALGHVAIKIAPFDDLTPALCGSADGERLIAAGLDRVRAVRSAIAGQADLRVDCHWRFAPDGVGPLVDELAESGVVWLECPIVEAPAVVPALRKLRSKCADRGMRLAGCETMNGVAGFRPYIDGEAYDVIMPDVKYAGGPLETLRIGEAAAAKDVACSLHNPSGPVSHLFSLHVATALGNGERTEHQFDESPLFGQLTDPAPRFADDLGVIPEGSGIGAQFTSATQPR